MSILIVEVDPLHQAVVIVKICFESQMLQNGTVVKIKIYVVLLIFRCHDIQINDGSGKVRTAIQFCKGFVVVTVGLEPTTLSM